MAIAPGQWVRDAVGVYIGNATAVRDYRVQLRGNRAVLLWALYLFVLIAFGLFTYSEAARYEQMSIVEAQGRLQGFYEQIVYLLTTMIALIAPALSATAIVSERQRRSLDLVFSAPVSPKYYLVGKLISSYRYIWMLLVLSLPVTSACVVLGGALWYEVLATYALLSLQGLVYTAIALVFSSLAQKPVGAIIWSYVGVIGYMALAGMIAGPLMIRPTVVSYMGGGSVSLNELPFLVTLVPYLSTQTATSITIIAGYHVPNWILAIFATLVIVRIFLAGAGSALSPFGSTETKSLRIHGLIYMFLLSVGLSAALGSTLSLTVGPMTSSVYPSTGFSPDPEMYFSREFLTAILAPLLIAAPFVTCYGVDLEKKFWPDGLVRPRKMLTGVPSGGLPYLLALALSAAAGTVAYSYWFPQIMGVRFFVYVAYGLSLVFAAWSIGRLTSAMNNGLRYARTLQFTGMLLALVLPLPFLAISDSWGYSQSDLSLWDFYVLRPLFSDGDKAAHAAVYAVLLIAIGIGLTVWSEKLARSKYQKMGLGELWITTKRT